MKTYKTETITREEKVVDVYSCDLCGKASPSSYDWGADNHHDLSVTIQLSDCNYGPGESSGQHTWTDICPECFKEKVVPAIEALGAVFRTKGVDDND
jgi:hypothetical protein